MARKSAPADGHVQRVELAGHIIDSLLLPKVLDHITAGGGAFRIEQIMIGQARQDPSYALIEVRAPSAERLQAILADIAQIHATGRPILIGSRTIEESEQLGQLLQSRGLACRVANPLLSAAGR